MEHNKFEAEWNLLQNQFESYEKQSLLIKLTSLTLFAVADFSNSISWASVCLLLIIWIQDAIWKTSQYRIHPRLLELERKIRDSESGAACQFNSEYKLVETGGLGKIKEYLKQATRPTIAFPHIVLIVLSVTLI